MEFRLSLIATDSYSYYENKSIYNNNKFGVYNQIWFLEKISLHCVVDIIQIENYGDNFVYF